ncbi:G-protein coupled receptor dmsr-1-like [Mya arenaria]|uniref:G-protein coupled receptor dmsr-1-like n=1 Tax=Mya arenaria TaxID=6604 RepID=UPI0022E4DF3F|nr:G-protein coupled receptor dmsr-1-like [Mya arenaria]
MNTTAAVATTSGPPMIVYHTETLDAFSRWYSTIHGYVSIIICVFGIPMNIINIIVLTRKKLQTPINSVLTWLAVADMATMMSYVPFAFHFYISYSANSMSAEKNTWGWMHFLLVYLNFSSTAHTISIWLCVALAIFRHSHIHSPAKGNLTRMRRIIRARVVVGIIFIASIILMIPNYLSHSIDEWPWKDNTTIYVFEKWNLGSGNVKPMILVSLILYSCLAKLVPCVLIIIYGALLLITLNNTRLKSKKRMSGSGSVNQPSRRNRDMSRTTMMLLIVIVLFLVTELPQGVLIMCCIFLKDFFEEVYIPLGDSMDIIALVNSSVNFVLYCSMSQEFRRTFINHFWKCGRQKRRPQRSLVSSHYNNDQLHASLTEFLPLNPE